MCYFLTTIYRCGYTVQVKSDWCPNVLGQCENICTVAPERLDERCGRKSATGYWCVPCYGKRPTTNGYHWCMRSERQVWIPREAELSASVGRPELSKKFADVSGGMEAVSLFVYSGALSFLFPSFGLREWSWVIRLIMSFASSFWFLYTVSPWLCGWPRDILEFVLSWLWQI